MNILQRWLDRGILPSNPIQREQTPMLQMLLLGMIGVACMSLFLALLVAGLSVGFFVVSGWLVGFILALRLLRRGFFSASLGWVTLSLLAGLFILMMPSGMNSVGMQFMLLTLPIILAGLLLSLIHI